MDRARLLSVETDRGATMPKPTRDLDGRSELFRTLWCRLCEIVIFSGATHHKLEVCIPVVRLNQCCHNMCGASSGTDALSPHGMMRGV